MRAVKNFLILFACAAFLFGCGKNNGGRVNLIKGLTISPASVNVGTSAQTQLECLALYWHGESEKISPDWSLNNSLVGTLSATGLFTSVGSAAAPLSGKIRAEYEGFIATAEVAVTPGQLNPPSGLAVSDLKPYSLKLSWSATGASGYIISFGTDAAASNLGTRTVAQSSENFSNLESNTCYYFKVMAYSAALQSSNSSVLAATTAAYPVKFSLSGNKILDDKGQEKIFRGVNILDPAWLDAVYSRLQSGHFDELKRWKANIIRIPIHPAAYKNLGKNNYLNLINRVLDYAAANEIYAILDYHSIGFPSDGTYQNLVTQDFSWTDSIYAYTDQEMQDFWKDISAYYKDDDRVVFFELFNEPTWGSGIDAQTSWSRWKAKAENLIDIIRTNDSNAKIIVGGLGYSYDVSYASQNPVNRQDIVYGTHPYPNQSKSWDEAFGNLSRTYPVFATEFGFDPYAADGVHYKTDAQYGTDIVNYLENKKISWTVWSFSPVWWPALLSDWNYNTTASGALFKNLLQSNP